MRRAAEAWRFLRVLSHSWNIKIILFFFWSKNATAGSKLLARAFPMEPVTRVWARTCRRPLTTWVKKIQKLMGAPTVRSWGSQPAQGAAKPYRRQTTRASTIRWIVGVGILTACISCHSILPYTLTVLSAHTMIHHLWLLPDDDFLPCFLSVNSLKLSLGFRW